MVATGGVVGTLAGAKVATATGVATGRDGDAGPGDVGDGGVTGSSDPPKQATAANMTEVAISVKTVRIAIT